MTNITFYGRLQDQFGRELEIELPDGGCTIGRLRVFLSEYAPVPNDALLQPSVHACVDGKIVRDDAPVRCGQDIAFMPPVSGG